MSVIAIETIHSCIKGIIKVSNYYSWKTQSDKVGISRCEERCWESTQCFIDSPGEHHCLQWISFGIYYGAFNNLQYWFETKSYSVKWWKGTVPPFNACVASASVHGGVYTCIGWAFGSDDTGKCQSEIGTGRRKMLHRTDTWLICDSNKHDERHDVTNKHNIKRNHLIYILWKIPGVINGMAWLFWHSQSITDCIQVI